MAEKANTRSGAAAAKAPTKTYYQVMHGAVGQWEQGAVISSDDLAGVDVDRLLRLGAIAETDEPRAPEPIVEEAPPAQPA